MSDQPKRKLTGPEIVESLRSKHRLSPALQQLVEVGRRKHEIDREALRAITNDFLARITAHAATLRIDPSVITAFPNDVLDSTLSSLLTLKALGDVSGTKLTFSFISEVTVNGVRVPDDE
jgi:hypothetical protein